MKQFMILIITGLILNTGFCQGPCMSGQYDQKDGKKISGLLQGSWNPPGADLSYPRTLLDSNDILEIRNTLENPGITELYQSIWNTANSGIPPEDTTDGARRTRAIIAREAAFVLLMDRKWDSGRITPLTPSEEDSLINRTLSLLRTMNTAVGYQQGWIFYQEWQNRSKELIFYLTAYDLLKGLGVSDPIARDSLIHFAGNLYSRAMATYTIFFMHFKFFDFQFNNHSIMTASALGLAALVLSDHEDANPFRQPLNWINAGLWNLDNTLWVEHGSYPRVSEPDTLAGYAEGPGYFSYAFQNAFPFIRSLWNFLPDDSIEVTFNNQLRKIRNPWYDPRYQRLYRWMNLIRMPDGSEPAIHDSPVEFRTTITALSGRPEFNLPFPGYSYDDPFIRTQYISTSVPEGNISDSLFQALPAAGSLCFRSSWDPGAVYMHFIGKHGIPLAGAKSHHQADASSFSLMAYGQLLGLDPGYPGAPESDSVNKAGNHSCILVNGLGPLPPAGEFVSVSTNTAFIMNYFHLPSLDYGEVHTSYFGDSIMRCNIFLHKRFFILNDLCMAPANSEFRFQFQGNGLFGSDRFSPEGNFVPDFANSSATYSRDSVNLLIQVQCEQPGLHFSWQIDSLATAYSTYRAYSKMLASTDSAGIMSFQTLLYPYKSDSLNRFCIEGLSGCSAKTIDYAPGTDFILTQSSAASRLLPPSQSRLAEEVSCNGQINLLGLDDTGNIKTVLLRGGDSISWGRQLMLSTGHPMLACWTEISTGIVEGYISDSGKISVYNKLALRATEGNINSVVYDSLKKVNVLYVKGKGRFRLEPSNGINPLSRDNRHRIVAYPNPSSDGIYMVEFSSEKKSRLDISVTDETGKKVKEFNVTAMPGKNLFRMDLSGLSPGTYLLKVISDASSVETLLIRF